MSGVKVDALGFAKTFVALKAKKAINQFVSGLSPADIAWLIANKRNLLEFVPQEQKDRWKAQAGGYKHFLEPFTNEDIYLWLPENIRQVIEATPDGNEWILQQLREIKREFFS